MAAGLPAHVDEADLISYGLVGLIAAIERFDLSREISFETYAITRVRGAILDELRALDWVPRVGPGPRPRDRARPRQARGQAPAGARPTRRSPTRSGMTRRRVPRLAAGDLATRRSPRSTSCGRLGRERRQVSLLDTLAGPDAPDPAQMRSTPSELKDRIADAIARLPEREKLVVALYYYENLTLREIGEVLGVTESRVSQLHTKAVLRLRSQPRRPRLTLRRVSRRRAPRPRPAPARAAGSGLTPRGMLPTPRRGDQACDAARTGSQRRARRPPRHRQDVAARGAAVRGRGDQPARARSPTARRSPTPTPTSRRARCRSRRR